MKKTEVIKLGFFGIWEKKQFWGKLSGLRLAASVFALD